MNKAHPKRSANSIHIFTINHLAIRLVLINKVFIKKYWDLILFLKKIKNFMLHKKTEVINMLIFIKIL